MKRETIIHNGIKFYRYPESKNLGTRNYFKAVLILHREIYKEAHGSIPIGMHVHHKDGNALNNTLENLELLDGREHSRHHALSQNHWRVRTKITCKFCGKIAIKSFSNKNKEADYCSLRCLSRSVIEANKKPLREVSCLSCGKTFKTRIARQKCCSRKCIAKWHNNHSRKERRKSGKYLS